MEDVDYARSIATVQEDAVRQVIEVFDGMSGQIAQLLAELRSIATGTEAADRERNDTLESISAIIEEIASGAMQVHEMAQHLQGSWIRLRMC